MAERALRTFFDRKEAIMRPFGAPPNLVASVLYDKIGACVAAKGIPCDGIPLAKQSELTGVNAANFESALAVVRRAGYMVNTRFEKSVVYGDVVKGPSQ